jgi:hypothetical protein
VHAWRTTRRRCVKSGASLPPTPCCLLGASLPPYSPSPPTHRRIRATARPTRPVSAQAHCSQWHPPPPPPAPPAPARVWTAALHLGPRQAGKGSEEPAGPGEEAAAPAERGARRAGGRAAATRGHVCGCRSSVAGAPDTSVAGAAGAASVLLACCTSGLLVPPHLAPALPQRTLGQ